MERKGGGGIATRVVMSPSGGGVLYIERACIVCRLDLFYLEYFESAMFQTLRKLNKREFRLNVTALKPERHTPPQAEGAARFKHHCF